LGQNKIGEEGVKHIAEALKKNKNLTTLDLIWNNIGDEEIQYINESLKENKNLTTLDLRWNNIGEKGLKDIANTLRENITLITLNLIGNNTSNAISTYHEINKLIKLNKKYKYMKGVYKLLQEEILEISLVPPDENNISVLKKGGPMYKELSKKYN
jgi:Ran GTPase-activating protein (RanGAP) involved in mRNA processing and transport